MTVNVLVQVLMVGIGGFIGSALRFLVGGWVQRLAGASALPFGTLVVNVLGCLILGFLGGIAEHRQVLDPAQRLFLMTGLLGGFTTFSTFAFESLALLQDAEIATALINVVLQVLLGLIAAFAGYLLARLI